MARTDLTAQAISRAGLAVVFAAANVDGHSWADNGQQLLQVKNTDAAPITVTFPIPVLVDGQTVASRTVTIPATTGDKLIGPFTSQYRQTDGDVWVDFSAITNVTCALLSFVPSS